MRLSRYRSAKCLAVRCGTRRCYHSNVGDIGNVGNVVHIIDRRNMHTLINDRWRTGHDSWRSTNRCWHDQAEVRTRWRRDKYALRAITTWAGDNANANNRRCNRDTHWWRYKSNMRRCPETIHKHNPTTTIFVVGIHPTIARLWRTCPAAMRPNPVTFPGPETAGPDRTGIRHWRGCFDQHRWWCPCDHDRCWLNQRRINNDTDNRLRRWRLIGHYFLWRRLILRLRIWGLINVCRFNHTSA